jgi:hypothetical protein
VLIEFRNSFAVVGEQQVAVPEESAERKEVQKRSLTLFAIVSDIFALQFRLKLHIS